MGAKLWLFLLAVAAVRCQLTCLHTDATGLCKECVPSYYLNLTVGASSGVCLLCPIVGCGQCVANTNSSCQVCKMGYTKMNTTNSTTPNYTCIACPPGQYYSAPTGSTPTCAACIMNCLYCSDGVGCDQCQPGYSLLLTGTILSCQNVSLFNSTVSITVGEWKSYLLALLPNNRARIYNSVDLSYTCYSNLYSCICANFSVSSRCQTFNTSLVNAAYNNFTSVTLNNSNLEVYSLAIESVLSNSTSTTNVMAVFTAATFNTLLLTLQDYSILLEAVAKLYYDWTTFDSVNTLFGKLSDALILNSATAPLSNQTIVLEGNGFIYRAIRLDNATTAPVTYSKLNITYSIPVNGYSCMLLLFNRSMLGQPVGPVLFLYEPTMTSGSQTRTIWLPQLGSLSATAIDAYQLQKVNPNLNVTVTDANVTSTSGMFTYTTAQAAGIFTIAPSSNATTSSSTTYDPFRIQNMFYKPSVFYILFFFLLYIIFVPLCMFVDFVDLKKTVKHKRIAGREQTHEELQVHDQRPPSEQNAQANGETEVVVPISYKQFHPIYNIATTQNRPARIAKLCLYLLNLQHCLFYLVVLYNAAPQVRQALLAILLVIPSYILNILSCYLFGFFKNRLPGNWKFVINIVPPCYWVGWFFLINSWTDANSPNYQTYLIIFTIVCMFLDQVFDLLQMMIMFFVLRQNNQVYPCLSRILSARGFFEYDKYSTQ